MGPEDNYSCMCEVQAHVVAYAMRAGLFSDEVGLSYRLQVAKIEIFPN